MKIPNYARKQKAIFLKKESFFGSELRLFHVPGGTEYKEFLQ